MLDAMGLFGTVAAPEQPQVIEVTLVPQAPPQAAAPPPQAAPEPPPPPPPPPEPETAPEEAAPPPPMPMARPEPPPMAPPAKPMLEAGKLGKESKQGNDKDTAGPQQAAAKESAKHTWLDDVGDGPPRQNLPMAANAQPIQMGQGGKHSDGGGNDGPTTQSERDFLLAQILRPWHNRPNYGWSPHDVVELRVVVMPDGYLAPPFDSRYPFMPARAIANYQSMSPHDPRRILLESLYTVLRVAQTLTLPPELRAKAPFPTVLDFKLVDLP